MSKIETRTITCPQCGKKGEQIVWDSINVGLDPEARERIFNEEIFEWTCPHCGLKAIAPFSTLYHNMEKKFMIYYFPQRSDNDFGISKGKGKFPIMDGYTCRSVYDLYDFKEKIHILESGLNDCAIEFMKYIFHGDRRPKELPENVQYRFVGMEPEDESDSSKKDMLFQCIVPGKGAVGVLPLQYDVYLDIVANKVGEKIFFLDADFPDVSQYSMEEVMKGH